MVKPDGIIGAYFALGVEEYSLWIVMPWTAKPNAVARWILNVIGGDGGVVEDIAPASLCRVTWCNNEATRRTIDVEHTILEEDIAISIDEIHRTLDF